MKKIVLFFALYALAAMVMGQIKVISNGHVGIGGIDPCWQCKMQIMDGPNDVSIAPNVGGVNVGSSTGVLDFWHSYAGWNHVRMKYWTLRSDSTTKTDIHSIVNATSLIKQIKTYSYFFKEDSTEIKTELHSSNKKEYGVLAQELINILPELVDSAKGTMFVNYNSFIGILMAGFNEQQAVIEMLQTAIVSQENEFINIRNELANLQSLVNACCEGGKSMSVPPKNPDEENSSPQFLTSPPTKQEKAMLYQNTPNPFSSNTEIVCRLPENFKNATLYINNLQGAELKSYPIKQAGLNTLTVYGSELSAGMYLYTLVVDNEIIDTKRMILTK